MDIKKIGTIAYMIVMVFYGLFTLILSIQAYTKFTDTTQYYDNIVSNLQQIPIVDVKSKSTQNCDSGYTSLFNWNWGGMSNGCDCTKATNASIQKRMYRGTCSANYTNYGCTQAPGINAQPFNYFEGPANTKMNVCIQRGSSQYAYYKVADQQKGVSCVGKKLCGNLAYPKSVFCVALTDPCPVYDIQVSSTQFDSRFVGYKVTNLPNGNYLYYDNLGATATKEPLSELRLTQGGGVCQLINTQKNLPSGQQDYVLTISNRTSCSSFDPTFVQNGFSIPENRYFMLNMNPTDYTTLTNYPGIQIPSSTSPFNTFQRNYLSWNIPNRNLMKDFVDASSSLNDLKSAQLVVMIINIFVCIMVSIILTVSEVYNLMGKDVPCIDGQGDEEQAKIKKTKKILSYGGKILQIPFLLWAFIVSAQKKGIISQVADAAPMDPTFNSQISSFSTQLEDQVYKKNLAALIVLGLTILLDILLFLKSKYCSKKEVNSQVEPAKLNMNDEQKPVNQSQFPMQSQPQYSNIPMQSVQPGVNQGYTTPLPVTQQPSYVQQQPVYVQPVQQQQPVYVQPIQQQPVYVQPVQQQQVYVQPVQYVQPAQQVVFVQPTQQPQNYY
ncbi:transmembrane protein, putative (macronuclear) [Tetrahymena thermophila SB210]|uniref:Transmembrane protein, putative n=1 Tax=Tetrahymena thermophila (strain SB210) TaxID=312017 RepID=A4VCX6_TETTS|nr:transmembrane protein, putative [Tetrahymena thermophila SB210]EDK31378.2 transmembrane protein, putative [Tetrahymena thermophila SB210]|eukprot:XP_001471013.2 transmembrane protein, putative [Tetrahymena thermophila SB210]